MGCTFINNIYTGKELETKDYNGVEIPKKVSAENIKISISLYYDGKHGREEFCIDEVTLEDFCSVEDLLSWFEISYKGETDGKNK